MAELTRTARLDPDTVDAVRRLVVAATAQDGVAPLSEHVLLHLRRGGDEPAAHLLAHDGGRLAGYAHLDDTDPVEGPSAELVVHPAHRRRGVGRQMLAAMPAGRLRLWAHGELEPAANLARSLGFHRVRSLWQMRRSLYAPLPQPAWPDGVEVRTFRPGRDEAEWTALNGLAFRDLSDQGSWTVDDLLAREAEPWFDPAGFFVAERAGRMVGFHWTKVHGGDSPVAAHDHDPVGEVYVVGVHPDEQGRGLGPALTLAGLGHLRALGLASVMLYVDESNSAAIGVYERLGFSRWDTDVMYRREGSDGER